MFRHLVVPLDGSEFAAHALPVGKQYAVLDAYLAHKEADELGQATSSSYAAAPLRIASARTRPATASCGGIQTRGVARQVGSTVREDPLPAHLPFQRQSVER
jgi:hypothetical protein